MRKEKHAPPFFRATSGVARFGKQFGCGHTPKFLLGRRPAKMLVGEPPQTRCCEVFLGLGEHRRECFIVQIFPRHFVAIRRVGVFCCDQ